MGPVSVCRSDGGVHVTIGIRNNDFSTDTIILYTHPHAYTYKIIFIGVRYKCINYI